jgi:hypothetical protein
MDRPDRRHRIVDATEKTDMRNILVIAALLLGASAYAQTPVPEPDTVDPVQQGDPAVRHLPPRADYVDDRQPLRPEELPQRVRRAAENEVGIQNWEAAKILHDRKKDEYIVEIKTRDEKSTYRFDSQGRRILEE